MMDTSGTATIANSAEALHPRHRQWLAQRGIQSDLAEELGLSTVSDSRGNWLQFPYRLGGRIVNRKRRMTAEKLHEMDKGGKLCLWNEEALHTEAVAAGNQSVIITEGEFDALIAMECGFAAAVSVPNGAPAEKLDDPVNANRYSFLWESKDALERVKEFILATDGDTPGTALAHDLSAILGPERCRFVTYPEGTKDLNEVFLRDGHAAVVALLTDAKPWPVRGLYRVSDFPEAQSIRGMSTGIDVLEDKMQIVLGTLTVFTGYANMGKSTVMNTILGHCISKGVSACVASFETAPKPILVDGIAKALIGCSNNDFFRHPQRQAAYDAIEQRMTIITNSLDEDLEFDIDKFLDLARVAVVRDGAKLILLDPWNELEHKRRRDETLTEYVGRAIRRIKAFARQHNVAFWIVAHPTKPHKGQNITMPSLYDVSDSANWSNKADYGLVYHRDDKTKNEAQLATVKVRMGLPGKVDVATVKFNHHTNRIDGLLSNPM